MTAKTKHDAIDACPEAEDLLALLTGELPADSGERLDRHVAGCSVCQAVLAGDQATLDVLASDDLAEETPDLVAGVLARLPQGAWQESSTVGPVVPFPRFFLRIAAAIILVVGVALIAVPSRTDKPQDPSRVVATAEHQSSREGLTWLVDAQDASGKWDPATWGGRSEYTVGLTGIALMSLVGTSESFPEREAGIESAVLFLMGQQDARGRFGASFDGTMYNHGIATVALLDVYTRQPREDLKGALTRARNFIADEQLASGGWGYQKRAGELANTSISTWQLQALLLAEELGWDDGGHSLRRGLAWLVGVVDARGRFGYEHASEVGQGRNTLTAMGAYCLLKASNIGMNIDTGLLRRVRAGLTDELKSQARTDFYRTYFSVCALNEEGVDNRASLTRLRQALLDARRDQGSWDPEDQWGPVGGRIYSTALASLSLE